MFDVLPDLSIPELRAVCAIADHGSLVGAAQSLGVSQPTLTRSLQRVEKALGVPLFRRTTRRVDITPAGRDFVALAARLLADLRLAMDNLRALADAQRGRVVVACVMSVAYTRLPAIVASFRAERPQVEIEVREGIHGAVIEDVRNGVADLGVTYLDDVRGEFSTVPLALEEFHVLLPRGHALADAGRITLDDVVGHPLVSFPKEARTRRLLESHALASGVALQEAVTVSQFATAVRCVAAGVGLALVPGGTVPGMPSAAVVARPLVHPDACITIGIATRIDRVAAPIAQVFADHLQRAWTPPTATSADRSPNPRAAARSPARRRAGSPRDSAGRSPSRRAGRGG